MLSSSFHVTYLRLCSPILCLWSLFFCALLCLLSCSHTLSLPSAPLLNNCCCLSSKTTPWVGMFSEWSSSESGKSMKTEYQQAVRQANVWTFIMGVFLRVYQGHFCSLQPPADFHCAAAALWLPSGQPCSWGDGNGLSWVKWQSSLVPAGVDSMGCSRRWNTLTLVNEVKIEEVCSPHYSANYLWSTSG